MSLINEPKLYKSIDPKKVLVRVATDDNLPLGTIFQLRKDTSTPGRTVFGWAKLGILQTDPNWLIYAEDDLGSNFVKLFAEFPFFPGTPSNEFVFKWSERDIILPGQAFINQFSVQFSGSPNSFATVPDSSDLNFANTDAFTIGLWCKAVSGSKFLYQKTSNAAGNNGYTLEADSSGRLVFQFRGGGTGDRIRVRTDNFLGSGDGSWTHVLVTKASGSTLASTVKVYVDGSAEILNVLNDTLSGDTTNSNVFALAASVTGTNRFQGNIDEFSFWNAELTSDEVTEIFNNNNGAIDLQAASGQIASALVSWWRMGDGAFVAIPDVPDEQGSNNMTLQSGVTSGDIESEVPP